jgi:murein endopeptidase
MVRRVAMLAALAALSCAAATEREPRVPAAPTPASAPSSATEEAPAAAELAVLPLRGQANPSTPEWLPPVDPQLALLGLDDQALSELIGHDLPALGSVSVGKANGGALLNGVRMPREGNWEIIDPARSFATQETVDYLVGAIEAVNAQFPAGTHPMYIGHMSREGGGFLRPHRSHQSGRDVDLGYYYVPERAEWYRPATLQTLDRARTWAFVRALVTQTDVEYIFISTRVQMLLKEYALSIGEDAQWLDSIFEFRSRNPEPIIRHTWGHGTHMHVRFFNPKAQAVGIRAYDALARQRVISPRVRLQPYLARPGDSYASLAQVAGHSARTIERTNRGQAVQPGQVLLVPIRGSVHRVAMLEVPPRRLPPTPATSDARVIAGPAGG